VTYFDCETESAKIHDDFPILKELCDRLMRLNPGETLAIGAFLEEVRKPPFGAGGTPLILALGHVIRAYGERLIIYKDSTKMVENPISSYDDLCKIIADPASKVVFEVRDISKAQSILIDLIAKAVGAPPLKHGETRSLNDSFEALKQWWLELPAVSKISDLYEKERQSQLNKLKELLNGLSDSVDRFDIMLEQLPSIYIEGPIGDTLTEDDAKLIGSNLAEDVKLFNSGKQVVVGKVARAVCEIFDTEGDIIECEKVINNWYTELNSMQRDPSRYDHEDAAHFLTRFADPKPTFNDKIMLLLPMDFGFEPVDDWSSLHVEDYAAKLKQAKIEIDKAKPEVYPPVVDKGSHELRETEELWAKIPDGASTLIYTTDGNDPKVSSKAQKVDSDVNLAELLKGQPNVKIKIRAIDQDGNFSDAVDVELVSKERKFEIQIKKEIIGDPEATFKCPKDKEELIAVLKSVIDYGIQNKLVNETTAQQFKEALSDLIKDE
jgi:hypothetical protein